jgi:hypothetical protein
MCMCVHGFVYFLIDLFFSHYPYVYVQLHLPFCLNILSLFLGDQIAIHS